MRVCQGRCYINTSLYDSTAIITGKSGNGNYHILIIIIKKANPKGLASVRYFLSIPLTYGGDFSHMLKCIRIFWFLLFC